MDEQNTETQAQTPEVASTPSTETPKVVTPDILSAYNNVLAEKDRQVREALAKLEQMEARVNAPPQLTPEESSKKFFENPVELIRNEIQRALQPVQQSIQTFTARNHYAELKVQMRQDPRFKDLDKIEREFDGLMANQQPEPNAMIAAYYAAYGMVASNEPNRLFNAGANNPSPNTPETKKENVVTPPHLRPSAPSAPSTPSTTTKRPALTENERMLMRINGITSEEDWWKLMDASPDSVVKIGGK